MGQRDLFLDGCFFFFSPPAALVRTRKTRIHSADPYPPAIGDHRLHD